MVEQSDVVGVKPTRAGWTDNLLGTVNQCTGIHEQQEGHSGRKLVSNDHTGGRKPDETGERRAEKEEDKPDDD